MIMIDFDKYNLTNDQKETLQFQKDALVKSSYHLEMDQEGQFVGVVISLGDVGIELGEQYESCIVSAFKDSNNSFHLTRTYSTKEKEKSLFKSHKDLVKSRGMSEFRIDTGNEVIVDNIRDLRQGQMMLGLGAEGMPPYFTLQNATRIAREIINNQGSLNISVKDKRGLANHIAKTVYSDLLEVLKQYNKEIHPGVFTATLALDEVNNSHVHYYGEKTKRGLYRRQAAESYPLLANQFSSTFTYRNVIDNAGSIKQTLADQYGLGNKALKRFRNFNVAPTMGNVDFIFETLTKLPPQWHPDASNEKEWVSFCESVALYEEVNTFYDGEDLQRVFSGFEGSWVNYISKIRTAFGLVDEDGSVIEADIGNGAPIHLMEGFKIMRDDFVDKLGYPIASLGAYAGEVLSLDGNEAKHIYDFANKFLFEGHSLKDLSAKVYRYSYNRAAIMNTPHEEVELELDLETLLSKWPALCEEKTAPNGMQIQPLTRKQQIKDEGNAMSHCVGSETFGYYKKCAKAEYAIFSIRNSYGERQSTLCMFLLNNKRDKYEVQQHYGFGNCTPSREAKDAVKWLIDGLNNKTIESNLPCIQDHRTKVLAAKADSNVKVTINTRSGYDIENLEDLAKVYIAWKDFGVKKVSKTNIFRGVEHRPLFEKISGAEEMINSINKYSDSTYNFDKIESLGKHLDKQLRVG